MAETVLTNARLVLENEVVEGSLVFDEAGIRAVDQGRSALAGAIDMEGDFVSPGLVEMHTDNMEKHFIPRPGVFWPDGLAAALAHDHQMAAAGVTTVFDSICAGTPFGTKEYRRSIFGQTIEAVSEGVTHDAFRIDHLIHIRCELTGETLLEDVTPHMGNPLVRLGSLMDHTPGQRQWRNIEDLRRYATSEGKKSAQEFDEDVARRKATGPALVARNWPEIVEMFASRGIPLATHDDTTEDDVRMGLSSGVVISEFPTTVEAAAYAHKSGLATVAGAPNVVRGGSHSGGVSAAELATLGVLDGLSSDYVPASLLQAVTKLERDHGLPLHQALAMVTWKVADMVGLGDRGHLKPGLRADILWFREVGERRTPVVRGLWSAGRRVL
jgi:alpha-D-ribose 1-methylphosphonate 5-triphosphate diphosphatase